MLTSRFEQALTYAAAAHAGQVRKGTGIPYLGHLLMVAALALEYGGDEDEAIAALLHDAVEDAGGQPRLEDIRRQFGQRVAVIVAGCTDADTVPKPPWRPRKEAYIAHLRHEADHSVRFVSACDKLANVRAILKDYRQVGEQVWERFNGGRDGSLWYYRTIADVFASHEETPLVRELVRAVGELEALSGGLR
jgi:(p)ppGpp synthase/HD superfamily hydrolase